jgi:hypothetical protein
LTKRSHFPLPSLDDRNYPLRLRSFPLQGFSMSPLHSHPHQPPLESHQSGGHHQPLTLVRSLLDLDQPRRGHFWDMLNHQCLTFSIHSNAIGSFQWTTSGPQSSWPKRLRMEKKFQSSLLPSFMPTWSSVLLCLYLTPSRR